MRGQWSQGGQKFLLMVKEDSCWDESYTVGKDISPPEIHGNGWASPQQAGGQPRREEGAWKPCDLPFQSCSAILTMAGVGSACSQCGRDRVATEPGTGGL